MKVLKFYLIVLPFLLSNQWIQAQSSPLCGGVNSPLPSWYTPDWDWTNASPSNWQGAILSNNSTIPLAMASPFTSNTNTDDMLAIVDGLDYLPEQGWTLLAKDFGVLNESVAANATPYFILYNKYRSILRVFMFFGNSNTGLNSASVILKWSSVNGSLVNNSLLTHANDFALANENYPITNNTEKQVNFVNSVSNSGGWGVTEFLVNFDPNTVKNTGNFQYINLDFKLSSNAVINLGGDFDLSTESATTKNPSSPNANSANPNLLDYVVNGKKALAKAPKKSELISGFDNISSRVNEIDEKFCNNFTRDLGNLNNSLQTGKLKDYMLGLAEFSEGLGGFLGIAGSVLELFMTKSNSAVASNNESHIQPTISKGTMTLTGSIVTESNPLSISLQLPGTSHKYSNGTVNCPNLPVYDCPLGVISLQEAPTIEVRTRTEPSRTGYFENTIEYGRNVNTGASSAVPAGVTEYSLNACQPGIFLYKRYKACNAVFPTKTIKSYKVAGDVKLSLNAQAGVEIENVKAALYFQIKKNNGTPSFDLLQTNITPTTCMNPLTLLPSSSDFFNPSACFDANTSTWNPQTTFFETTGFTNYAKQLLNKGDLRLSNFDESEGLHSFQTPFIDITKFKNTAITLEDGCDVFLKLLITLRPTNPSHDQTPIIQVVTYRLPANKFIANSSANPHVMTCEQRFEEDTVIVGTNDASTTIGNATFVGYAIQTASNAIVTVNPATTMTYLEAFSSIKLRPDFKTQIQSNVTFRAVLGATAMGCTSGANALSIQTYTYNCQGSGSTNRFANLTDEQSDILTGKLSSENTQNIRVVVAPNPNNGTFRLLFSNTVNAGTVRIYNGVGQEIFFERLDSASDSYDLKTDNVLTSGVYHLTWNNDTFVINEKIVVN